jgi:hypothetical protein
MQIKVSYDNYSLRNITSIESESIFFKEPSSLGDMLVFLGNKYGEKIENLIMDPKGKSLKVVILINGLSVNDFKHMFCEGDQVNILSFSTGG